ncbi:hypothetical protein ABT095_31700 [Kitasatospora sp. NPDC002227]|uniref:hypothetical protein n=1 Tax=Kitasatospora sp. NPDC002227 TaxID=3154773 RepID=UPI00331F5944
MQDTDGWLPPLRAGRQPAGRALLSWLDDPQAPRLCRVAGSPGSGKSHLVSWLATACDRRPGVVAFSLAGLSLEAATWLLAQRLEVFAVTPEELVAAVAADDRPRLLVLWELNRAAASARIAQVLLTPLLALPHVRAVLEVDDFAPEMLARAAVLDLDQPGWTDLAKFARWYRELGSGSPFPAESLNGNPRLARLAARVPAGTDPTQGVAAAWWSAAPPDVRAAMSALAAAHRPLSYEEWSVLAGAPAVSAAAEWLPPHSAAGGTWWLPPGELRDVITASGPAMDGALMVRALADRLPRGADGGPDLPKSGTKELGLLLMETAWTGGAQALLEDPRLVAYADPAVVSDVLGSHIGTPFGDHWRAAGPAMVTAPDGATRAAVLRARLLGVDPAAAAALDRPGAWRAEWGNWLPRTAPRLRAGALTQGPYTGYVMLVDASGAMRAGNLTDGRFIDVPADPAPAQPRSLTALPDGTVVALDAGGRAQLLAGATLPALPGAFEAEMSVLGPAGAVGDVGGRVLWLPTGAAEPLHNGPVTALGGAVLADNHVPTLVSGGLDGCVRVWLPGAPPLEKPVDQRDCAVVSVSVHQGPQGLLAATGWADGLVRIYLLDRPGTRIDVRLGSPVLSVLIDAGGRIVVVLPEGVVCLTVDPKAPTGLDLSGTPGFYFSPEPPNSPLEAVPGPMTPLPDPVRSEARDRPGQWLYELDISDETHAPLIGCRRIDHQGVIVRCLANPEYSAKLPDAGTAVQRYAARRLNDRDLVKALVDAELHVCTTAAGGTELFVRPGRSADYLDACTSPELVPRHWPGTAVLTGREIHAALPDGRLLVNPRSEAVEFPINGFHGVLD